MCQRDGGGHGRGMTKPTNDKTIGRRPGRTLLALTAAALVGLGIAFALSMASLGRALEDDGGVAAGLEDDFDDTTDL